MSELAIKVIDLIREGLTIEESIKVLGENRVNFYKELTVKEKLELNMEKTAQAKYGVVWQKYHNKK